MEKPYKDCGLERPLGSAGRTDGTTILLGFTGEVFLDFDVFCGGFNQGRRLPVEDDGFDVGGEEEAMAELFPGFDELAWEEVPALALVRFPTFGCVSL